MNNIKDFVEKFNALTTHSPFPWQTRLYRQFVGDNNDRVPHACCLPTGLGKTSIIAVWMIALAHGAPLPRRLVYVVNRRTVVDQTTNEMTHYRDAIKSQQSLAELRHWFDPLRISTLRGQFADNGEWCENPARPAIVCGTVDMIGSRLLFSGYRLGFKSRPLHAAFLSQDALLVHDEAHLEPAFQQLIEQIRDEQQREPHVPWPKLHVMELTATSKTQSPFGLNSSSSDTLENDYAHPQVKKRMNAQKELHLHPHSDDKKPQTDLAQKAIGYAQTDKAILVFANSVETVLEVASTIIKAGIPAANVRTLTGTMRGKERDALAGDESHEPDKAFARFLPEISKNACQGTVYLICTSAGEVGVNISANHLICDLSTYESMAQRFGRVNRFGINTDSEVHVFFPLQWDPNHPLTPARRKTLELLQALNGTASPKALDDLPTADKNIAFAPKPEIPATSEILFDAWSLTSIRDRLPGRPDVEPWLHGVVEYEPTQTKFAWRKEVDYLSSDDIPEKVRVEVLDAYPPLQRELLTEPSYRAQKHLQLMAKRHPDAPAWIVDDFGRVEVMSLSNLADKDNKQRIERKTILLDPKFGGLNDAGMLDGNSESATDVSETTDRCRRWDHDSAEPLAGTHEIYSVSFPSADEDHEPKMLRWFVRRHTGEARSRKPVLLHDHVRDVENHLAEIIERLSLGERLNRCLTLAAKHHDNGKARVIFQAMLGNSSSSSELWAKSGKGKSSIIQESYRHEFGSLHELPSAEELRLSVDERELVLHLIAAHHGRARPYFPADEIFDPNYSDEKSEELAREVTQRFGRLQQKFGRWGLAYLESLLRAADWSASANPTHELEST